MKKKDFRVMNNQDVEVEFDGKAIAFIKSRKADHKIHVMAEEMIKMALAIGIELTDVIVDGAALDMEHNHTWAPECPDDSGSDEE